MSEDQTPNPQPETAVRVPPMPRRRRWVSIVLTLVIFLAGMIAGVGGLIILVRYQAMKKLQHPEQEVPRMAARIGWQLKLNPVQVKEVEKILRNRMAALDGVRREVQPRVNAELDLVDKQITELLDARQAENWHKIFLQYRKTCVPSLPGLPK